MGLQPGSHSSHRVTAWSHMKACSRWFSILLPALLLTTRMLMPLLTGACSRWFWMMSRMMPKPSKYPPRPPVPRSSLKVSWTDSMCCAFHVGSKTWLAHRREAMLRMTYGEARRAAGWAHRVAASRSYGCSPQFLRLQPPDYGCNLQFLRLQPLVPTVTAPPCPSSGRAGRAGSRRSAARSVR